MGLMPLNGNWFAGMARAGGKSGLKPIFRFAVCYSYKSKGSDSSAGFSAPYQRVELFAQGLASSFLDFHVQLLRFFIGIVELLAFLQEYFTLPGENAFLFRDFLFVFGQFLLLFEDLDPSF